MYDAALRARRIVEDQPSDLLDRIGVAPGAYAVATLHRAETTDDVEVLEDALTALRRAADTMPVVFPVHPRTSEAIAAAGLRTDGLLAMSPVGYLDMTRLLVGAAVVYTDSGGLQKEAYFHRVPCVTLRSETEWVETIDAGWNRLWTTPEWKVPRRDIPDYGDGHAGPAIATVLADWLGAP
jgi:UDP-GlcNAc3NAcA epimerase